MQGCDDSCDEMQGCDDIHVVAVVKCRDAMKHRDAMIAAVKCRVAMITVVKCIDVMILIYSCSEMQGCDDIHVVKC